jgi:hypothetical protein
VAETLIEECAGKRTVSATAEARMEKMKIEKQKDSDAARLTDAVTFMKI